MMRSQRPILLWLAASRFPLSDLYEFFKWVEERGAPYSHRELTGIRDGGRLSNAPSGPARDSGKPGDKARIAEHQSMITAVEHLLLGEAKLTKQEATRIILSELEGVDTRFGYLSSPNKISFRSWLAKIGEDVSDSRVLHIASRVRNQIVHGDRSVSDWPI